jgi:hypothetical protein
VAHEFISGVGEAVINKRNERIALALSLKSNSPDVWGRDMYRQAAYILEQYRPDWENLDSPVANSDAVEIPAKCPVGVVPFVDEESGGFITTRPLDGTLISSDSLFGGSGYMEPGRKKPNSLFRVAVSFGEGEGKETIELFVPSWYRSDETGIYSAVLRKSLGKSLIAQIAA